MTEEQIDSVLQNFYQLQTPENYERSHEARYNFLIQDLQLDQLENQRIADVGCGLGTLIAKLPQDKGNTFFGIDGADIAVSKYKERFKFYQRNLDLPFSKEFVEENGQMDSVFCFETLEHVTNPYNCLYHIKKILKPDGTLYLSIPAEDCTHNTIYPALLFPKTNFIQFLGQMALHPIAVTRHDKAFSQNVFICTNGPWESKKMMFHKLGGEIGDDFYKYAPPHVFVNV